MQVEDITIMLKTAKDPIRYNKNTQYLECILVYDTHIRIVLNRFKNTEGHMVEEATVYPMEAVESYTYIEVGA